MLKGYSPGQKGECMATIIWYLYLSLQQWSIAAQNTAQATVQQKVRRAQTLDFPLTHPGEYFLQNLVDLQLNSVKNEEVKKWGVWIL